MLSQQADGPSKAVIIGDATPPSSPRREAQPQGEEPGFFQKVQAFFDSLTNLSVESIDYSSEKLEEFGDKINSLIEQHRAATSLLGAISKATEHIHKWNEAELSIGMKYLYDKHYWDRVNLLKRRGIDVEDSSNARCQSYLEGEVNLKKADEPADSLKSLHYWLRFASAAYRTKLKRVCKVTGMEPDQVLHFDSEGGTEHPAFYLAVDHISKRVVLGLRGTRTWADALVDLAATNTDLFGGHAHSAMAQWSMWFMKNFKDRILTALEENADYGLTLVGHSLGAGTAALLTMRMQRDDKFEPYQLECFAYACPAVVSKDLTENKSIHSVVFGFDMVPRLSLYSIEQLHAQLKDVDWQAPSWTSDDKTLLRQTVEDFRRDTRNSSIYAYIKDRAGALIERIKNSSTVANMEDNFESEVLQPIEEQLKLGREELEKPIEEKCVPMYLPGDITFIAYDSRSRSGYSVYTHVDAEVFAEIQLFERVAEDHRLATYQNAISVLVQGDNPRRGKHHRLQTQ